MGYAGGAKASPTYKEVCRGGTGHAEAVEVTFDPKEVSYERLLAAFASMHDTAARRGEDSQYRSVIFFRTPAQEKAARAWKEALEKRAKGAVATQIVPAGTFWEAEDYHQRYYEKSGVRSE